METLNKYIHEKFIINKDTKKRSDINKLQDIIDDYLSNKYHFHKSVYTINEENPNQLRIKFTDCIKKGSKLYIVFPTGDYEFGYVFDKLKNYIQEVDNHKYEERLWGSCCNYSSQTFEIRITN